MNENQAANDKSVNELRKWLLVNEIDCDDDDSVYKALIEQSIDNIDQLLLFNETEIKLVFITKIKIGKIAKLIIGLREYRNLLKLIENEEKNSDYQINQIDKIDKIDNYQFSKHLYETIKLSDDLKVATNNVSNYGALYVSNNRNNKNSIIFYRVNYFLEIIRNNN